MNTRREMVIQMLKDSPEDAFLIYALALEEHKDGDLIAAIKRLESLSKTQPDYIGTYYQLGKFYEQEMELEKAISIYKSGISKAVEQNAKKMERELKEALMIIDEDFE